MMREVDWYDESVELTKERVDFVANRVAHDQTVSALKDALTALSIIATMGDIHSRKIAVKAIQKISSSDARGKAE